MRPRPGTALPFGQEQLPPPQPRRRAPWHRCPGCAWPAPGRLPGHRQRDRPSPPAQGQTSSFLGPPAALSRSRAAGAPPGTARRASSGPSAAPSPGRRAGAPHPPQQSRRPPATRRGAGRGRRGGEGPGAGEGTPSPPGGGPRQRKGKKVS